jgi:hypothetical protein
MRTSRGQCYFVAKIIGSCVIMLIVAIRKRQLKLILMLGSQIKNGQKKSVNIPL